MAHGETDPNGPQTPRPKPPKENPNKPAVPQVVLNNAEKFNYDVVRTADGGWKLVHQGAGYHKPTDDEMKFLQHVTNKYGITQNGTADFVHSAFINGNLFRLSTGQGEFNGGASLTDEQLAAARARAGWTPEVGYDKALADYNAMQKQLGNPGSGALPTYLATPEGYQALLDSQRAGITGQTGTTASAPVYQPFTDISGSQQGVPGYPYTQYPDAASALTAAHTNLASHYASAAQAGDFAAAGAAQTALMGHQGLLPQNTGYTAPDTFDETHLYNEAQNR